MSRHTDRVAARFGRCAESKEPILTITDHGHEGRITGAYWMPLNKAIMTTGGDGTIKLFDAQVRPSLHPCCMYLW